MWVFPQEDSAFGVYVFTCIWKPDIAELETCLCWSSKAERLQYAGSLLTMFHIVLYFAPPNPQFDVYVYVEFFPVFKMFSPLDIKYI